MANYTGVITTQPTLVTGRIDVYDVVVVDSYSAPRPIYRGKSGGVYVYAVGSIPVGATDVVVAGYV